MKILFIGATGMLGTPVAKELINAGHDVSLFARNKIKMDQYFPGRKIIRGDIYDKAGLVNVLAGQDIVYMNLSIDQGKGNSSAQPEREGIENIIDAAKKTGIRRIAYLSSLIKNYQGMNGFNWWAFELKQKAIDTIKSSDIPYSIFYPSSFFETMKRDMLRGNKLILVSGSVAPMWFIGAEDYGRQVAKAFEIAGKTNQEYVIQGLEPFTFGEANKVFRDHYKTKLKLMRVPLFLAKLPGLFSHKINYGSHILEALNNYPEKFESEKTWNDLGKPRISLKEYAASL